MSDLIDRNAVMLRVREFIGNPTYDEIMLVNDLNALPSAEPERKKGKWLGGNGTDTFIHCSVCYEEAYWDSDYGQQTFDFCPYCGADMRGE